MQRTDVLAAAWRRVKMNAGAAGVDGITIEELAADAQVEAAWLSAQREELHRKTYRPAPVRRWPLWQLFKTHGLFRLPTAVG